eukprot:1391927-Amorphochlora_amoeboformis.AAC.1
MPLYVGSGHPEYVAIPSTANMHLLDMHDLPTYIYSYLSVDCSIVIVLHALHPLLEYRLFHRPKLIRVRFDVDGIIAAMLLSEFVRSYAHALKLRLR